MSSGIAKKALSVIAVIIAFVAVRYGMQAYREYEAVTKAGKSFEQLKADATQKHPGVPLSVAIQQEATEGATKQIASQADDLKRANAAADIFWGFFFLNVRERPEFCREQGVDIQTFVKAFERSHANEVAKARSIYARASADENKIYTLIKPQLRWAIGQDMNDIAASNKISVKEGCQLISETAEALAQEMHLSKRLPAAFKALTSAR